MKNDIVNRKDIELLITSFYEKVKSDDTIGYIFNDIAKVNWQQHLPVMFDFWENVLFYTGAYNGNPMVIHQHLHRVVPLTKTHFKQWEKIFIGTVDELFDGSNAVLAKQRALSISTVMQMKIMTEG